MKKSKIAIVLLTVLTAITFVLSLCACDDLLNFGSQTTGGYTVSVDTDKPLEVEVGEEIDYKQYFIVTDANGHQIVVTDAMIDTSEADTTKEGRFTVTLTIGAASKDLTFTVIHKGDLPGNTDDPKDDVVLEKVFAKYTDFSDWNFAVFYREMENGEIVYEEYYEYYGNNILCTYKRYDDNDKFLGEATDYLGYEASEQAYYLYYDNLNGTYSKYKEDTSDFTLNYNLCDIDLTTLGDYKFTKTNDGYDAENPAAVGDAVIGIMSGFTWSKFTVYIENGSISQIDATIDDGYVVQLVFDRYNQVNFTLPNAGSSGGNTEPIDPSDKMEKQTYDAAAFDGERLQDKLTKTGQYADPAIGLPSTGAYHALVIPVQFSNTSIYEEDLSDLNVAFNGTSEQTGWESVATYYQKASYGQLDLSFDIAGYNIDGVDFYTTGRSYSYYAELTATENGETYKNGENVLLREVLAYYESRLDLTRYDTNEDGTIDAVYLIYSAPVDYVSDDSFYWAYVTWNNNQTKYDGMDAYYYLFAGFDFMKESVQGKNINSNYPIIPGLKINAATYIHETGHLLGLDDYYDYYPDEGCNEGLGGADMMDATVGDQNVYSKIMLGWLTPTIVTTSTTITIKSSQEQGDAVLIPLNFNNSYFCEYLLIDLYSAQGLNALHASTSNSYLYDGAPYGVRIYHVSSSIENAYDNDFGSFTDNNNSQSDTALIKLVEADGETQFASSEGYATENDLWQAGDTLSGAFAQYKTNGGKLLIFDIQIVSVSATEATITVTYYE